MILAAVAARAVDDPKAAPPVVMPAFGVMESALKMKIAIDYKKLRIGEPWVSEVRVADVKSPSLAEQLGLKAGMEIVAIDGKRLAGLSQTEMERIMAAPKPENFTLLVKKSWLKAPEEIKVSLRAVAAP